MVAPVQKDSLTEWQQGLATYLRISSPIAGMFTGSEIKPNPNARSIRVPDIRVDDYITDAEIGRIGTTHYQGSEFTGEWKNGVPPIFWREYSMSRHRSFGFTVFDEQLRYSPIKNIVQEYVGRKMQTTVIRDHDKYCLLAAISGHMTGKLVPRVAGVDTVGPQTADAHRISNTGNAADYKWIAEPGEDYDNQIQPSFATIKGMFLDDADPLKTLDALTLTFSDNWFDSNFGNNERFLLITSALELVFINALISKGAGTESAFKLYRDGDISGAQANGYLGTLKGSWKLVKIHPEWLPKVFTDSSLVVDPVADTSTANRTLRQVVALAAYKNAIQTYEHFSEKRQQDGGVRFKGTEYVQDFSYDAWAIDQLSEGIVPLFMPNSPTNLAVVNTSFTNVAAQVAAARAQKSVSPNTYPISGADTVLSRPEWYHQVMGYENTTALNTGLPVQETGDVAHRNPLLPNDDPTPIVAARANTTAYSVGQKVTFSNGQTYTVSTAGTTGASQPATTGIDIGETLVDGGVTWRRVN
ncbi:hypothetical protein SEA_ARAXXI_29 [Microbacterium phage Araxxi]|uniref:Uncharacterized protein n=1 Tax=Microbacterium phage Araxxi TaxID=2590948 RepID=A0A516KT39_9CAUD|nr:hypothetical protein HWC57_gp29 [Microbacterium phage Araxxi]QDP44848.1 hypothetical protein SEA_ARAXXI_29 [Microbacterium phage Araxxi]USH45476.1 hypothetical protein SEA_DOTI_29 [Microbacterium phage DoTi]